MGNKITASLFYMGIIATIITILLSTAVYKRGINLQVESDLKLIANLIESNYDSKNYNQVFSTYNNDNMRITLVNSNGLVLFDNEADVNKMGTHINRPEIQEAKQNGHGFEIRRSSTLSESSFYYALRLKDGNYLRVALEDQAIYQNIASAYPLLFLILFFLCVISIFLAIILTKILVKPIKNLANEVDHLDVTDDQKVYKEIAPFVRKIQNQRIENKKHISDIEAEKNRLSSLVENMSEGFILLNNDLSTVLINKSALEFLQTDNPIQNPDINHLVNKAFKDSKESSVIKIGENIYNVSAEPIIEKNQKTGVMCLMLDITERSKVDKIKRDFTTNVSHELKTPLTSISGYSEMMQNGMVKSEDISKFAGVIHKESKRLLTLISDIIKLSELDEPASQINFTMVDLLEVANECAEIIRTAAEKKEISVSVTGSSSFVKANRHLLFEMIYNICDNAVRYNKQGGSIDIQVSDKKISVTDTGIGIPEKYQSRIFERFYRIDKSRSKETGGTGLGLSIVKHGAELNNATIKLKSKVGKGTQVIITF